MIDVTGRNLDLVALSAELTAANVTHLALGTRNGMLHTYNEAGDIIELPDNARAVVNAHQPPPAAPTRDERLQTAVESAKEIIGSGGFSETQAAKLAAVFDGLGTAITGGQP